jgi:tetratricopeptide (TPR) repeat protein
MRRVKIRKMKWSVPIGIAALALCAFLVLGFAPPKQAKTPKPAKAASYPYKSDQFTKFVADSYKVKGSGGPEDFYSWFDSSFKDVAGADPSTYVAEQRARIQAIKDPAKRSEAEQELGGNIHHFIKKVIPKFSLQNGFEFYKAKDLGQRQCFLQSVLVSGLLQKAGVNSGVVMVYKNITGQSTNNGHAVAVERLSNGKDVLVDCSDPQPNVEHQGLFLRDAEKDYLYVNPQYDGSTGIINAYREEGTTKDLAPRSLSTLDIPFIYSMFDYYRGERTPGGFFETPTNKAGLEKSAAYLRKAIQENPRNPLAVYMLGHIYQKLGKTDAAASQYLAARDLYDRYGWIPQGVVDALASAH